MATTQKAVVFKEEDDKDTSQEAMVAAEQHRVDSIDESMFDLEAIRQKEKSFEQGSDDEAVVIMTGGRIEGTSNYMGSYGRSNVGRSYGSKINNGNLQQKYFEQGSVDEAVVTTGGRVEGSNNIGIGSYDAYSNVGRSYGLPYGSNNAGKWVKYSNSGSDNRSESSVYSADHGGGMNSGWFWITARRKKVHRQNGAQAFLRNSTLMQIRLNKSCNWSGKPSSFNFPKVIAPRSVAQFTHLKGNEFGSKAAVIYTGFNAVNIECAWLLAWDAPAQVTDNTPNKLYVACGPRRHICKMSCEQILAKLENGLPDVISRDKASKTKVEALIHRQVPNTATIIAMFKLIPFHQ